MAKNNGANSRVARVACVAGVYGMMDEPDSDDVYREKLEELVIRVKSGSKEGLEALRLLVSEGKAAAKSLTAAPKFLKIVRGRAHANQIQTQPLRNSDAAAPEESTFASANSAPAAAPANVEEKFENVEALAALLENEALKDGEAKALLLELLSFLCCADASGYRALQYRVQANQLAATRMAEPTPFGFGDEYLQTLASQIVAARADPLSNVELAQVRPIVEAIAPHWMAGGNELEAVDLLYEAEMLRSLPDMLSAKTHDKTQETQTALAKNPAPIEDHVLVKRLGPYLVGLAQYAADAEEWKALLKMAYEIYSAAQLHFEAFQVAMVLDSRPLLLKTLAAAPTLLAKQIALVCSRHSTPLPLTDDIPQGHQVVSLSWGERQSGFYLYLAQELDLLEPKTAEEVLKEQGTGTGGWKGRSPMDSSLENLGKTLVNCFVNAGFCTDKLLTVEHSDWVFKHKDYAAFTAALLSALIHLWNVDEGLSVLDAYQYSEDSFVRGGALAGFGLVSCGVWPESDPVLALVMEHLHSPLQPVRLGSVLSLALAYAGTCREDLLELLAPLLLGVPGGEGAKAETGENKSGDAGAVAGWAALALGLIFAGSASADASELLITALLENSQCGSACGDGAALETSSYGWGAFLGVALALVYLGKRDAVELALEAVRALPMPTASLTALLLESFAFAASGDMLRIQKMLQVAVRQSGPDTAPDESPQNQTNPMSIAAILGIALISLGEPLQEEMAMRLIQQPLSCGTFVEKRVVPLALALISLSNPKNTLISLLSKLTRDPDDVVAINAVIAMGFVGAGTNNSRIAQLLQQQAAVYAKDPQGLLCVRLAQAMLHLGKGLLTLNPVHSDGMLVNRVSLAALAALFHLGADLKALFSDMPYAAALLGLAIKPRWLVVVDENLEPRAVPLRVGAALDTLGQAGNPRRISGFQTHNSPVLIGLGQRAELVTGASISPVLEGIVIMPSANEQAN